MEVLSSELEQAIQSFGNVAALRVYPYYLLVRVAKNFYVDPQNPIILAESGVELVYYNGYVYSGRIAKELSSMLETPISHYIITSLYFPSMYNLRIPQKLAATECSAGQTVYELFQALNTDLPRYKMACNYVLFNHFASSPEEVISVLNFSQYADKEHLRIFMINNMDTAAPLFDSFDVFAMNKAWLGLNNQMGENLVVGFAEVHFYGIKLYLYELFADYENLLKEIQEDPEFYTMVHESRYDAVTQSAEFQKIMDFVHRYFYNVCSIDHLQFLQQDIKLLADKFHANGFDQFEPIFSLRRKPDQSDKSYLNYLTKYRVAWCVFPRILCEVLHFFTVVDQKDLLLYQIDKLRSEQLAIIQENNIEQNEIVYQSVYLDKLSLIFQPILAQYVDATRTLFIQHLQQYYNFPEIIESLGKKISNFARICPGIDKFSLKFFKSQRSFKDARICLPGFCFEEEFSEFAQNLIDSTYTIPDDQDTINRYAAFCGALMTHFNILKQSFKDLSLLYLKAFAEQISKRLSKTKALLLRFLQHPQGFHYFAVKEDVNKGRQIRPIEDIYAQEFSSIRNVIQNIAIYLFLCPEDSQFLRICENYQLLRQYQPAGVVETVGGTYHYDCLIKDSQLSDALHYTVKKLSVTAFRYFIIQYCALIFLSSLVFKQYKGHAEYCSILSSFSTLEQDRFIYLICYISNSLNIICNVKGFTEMGAIGYINVIFDYFLTQVTGDMKRDDLEELIMLKDFDYGIVQLCYNFQQDEEEEVNTAPEASSQLEDDDAEQGSFYIGDRELHNLVVQMREMQRKPSYYQGEKLLFRMQMQDAVDNRLEYASRGALQEKFVDFVRSNALIYQQLSYLCYCALIIRHRFYQAYAGSICYFYAQLTSPFRDETRDDEEKAFDSVFLAFYNRLAGSLYIRNECQVDVFPVITDGAALTQLVSFGDGKHDDNYVLDEIIEQFCWLSQQFGRDEEELTESALLRVIRTNGPALEQMVYGCVEMETLHALFITNPRFTCSCAPLAAAEPQVSKAHSYYCILSQNAMMIEYLPELGGSYQRYQLIKNVVSKQTEFAELQEFCVTTLRYLLNEEKIDILMSLQQYFATFYDTDFRLHDSLRVGDVLVIAAFIAEEDAEANVGAQAK